MASRLSEAERQTIAEHLRAGKSGREISELTGRSWGTIYNVAKAAGLKRDVRDTKKATETRLADMREQRAVISQQMLRNLLWVQARLTQDATAADVRNYLVAMGIAIDKHLDLERHDSDEGSKLGAAVTRWLDEWR